VLIFVNSYEAKKFWVYGQIDRPGEYAMSQQLTVMDAILMAGGLDFYGANEGYLHRACQGAGRRARRGPPCVPGHSPEGHTVERLDLAPMRRGGLLEQNPLIMEGDILVIPTRYPTLFYVLGDVVKPAYFQINSDERMTVSGRCRRRADRRGRQRCLRGSSFATTPAASGRNCPSTYKAILEGRQAGYRDPVRRHRVDSGQRDQERRNEYAHTAATDLARARRAVSGDATTTVESFEEGT